MVKVSPSILSADFLNLEYSINSIIKEADMLHIDVMDGHYVPNISIGLPIVKAIRDRFQTPLDVHLMISNPDDYIKAFIDSGSDILTVHYETCTHLNRTVSQIKKLGAKAFVSLNPHTPIFLLSDIIEYIDGVLIMSVNPGFGGQSFIENSYARIKEVHQLKEEKNPNLMISVDGGINTKNARRVVESGATILVAGSAVFKSEDPSRTIRLLKGL